MVQSEKNRIREGMQMNQKFSELEYVRPDIADFGKAIQEATARLEAAENYEQARSVYFELQEMETAVDTMATLASIRNTIDTRDAFYEEEMKWIRKEHAQLIPLEKQWSTALSKSRFRPDFTAEFGEQAFRLIDASLLTQDERLIDDTVRAGEICQAYQKDSALAQTDFRGEKCNFYGLLKHMESTDREERKEAFHAWASLYESISGKLDAEYDELVHLRDGMARKLGFPSYTEYAYLSRRRFDYTQEDVAAFRKQILEVVTPAVAEIRERQRKHLGVDCLHYYDEALLFPKGNPDPIGNREELVGKAQKMYREMSPETGEFFDFMVEHELFDLETKPGKRMGGYMTRLPGYQAPFIFSNFNGTSADVDVLTHEAGHAFQGYLAMRSIPMRSLCGSTSEINEIHSMSMEHFAYPWMESFFEDKREDYITNHLIGAVAVLPYMACVDEFQHRVYAQPQMNSMERRGVWREIEKKYMPWRDYDGDRFLEEGGFWMQKQHIFLYPFYYIDYALAQMCAFQYYGRMKEDRNAAWQDYLRLCRAGGQQGYFELLKEGNLLNPFHEGTVEKSIGHVLKEISERY